MSYDPPLDVFYSGSGEVQVSNKYPIVQMSAEYGIQPAKVLTTVVGVGASVDVIENKYRAYSGTDAFGVASILSRRIARNRSGQGMIARLSALFPVGIGDGTQFGGFATSENGAGFARVNGIFGILHYFGGEPENWRLLFTVSGAGAATVTVNGLPYLITLTAGTVQHNAYEAAQQLDAAVPDYTVVSNGATVIFQSLVPGPAGSFDYTGVGTATFTQMNAGIEPQSNFYPQTQWNLDTADWLDAELGNVYGVQMQAGGFGAINFFVQDPETSLPLWVHSIEWPNSTDQLNSSNPNVRVGWIARNTGQGSNLEVQGGAAAIFIEGAIKVDGLQSSASNEQIGVPTTNYQNILAIRNRISFNGRPNRIEIYPNVASLSTQTNKYGIFKLLLNPTFGGDVTWEYIDEASSVVEVAKDNVSVSGGTDVGQIVLTEGQTVIVQYNNAQGKDLAIVPGQVIALCGISAQNAGDFQAAFTVEQDD